MKSFHQIENMAHSVDAETVIAGKPIFDYLRLSRKGQQKYPPRRWVVERTFGRLSKCRGLLARYEKKSENYLGLLQFAKDTVLSFAKGS